MRLRIAQAVVFVLCGITAAAQQFVVPRPDPSRITIHRDLETRAAGKVVRFDVYRPAGSEVVPVVITCNFGNAGMRQWPGYVGWGEVTAAAGLASVHYDPAGADPVVAFDAILGALRAAATELHIDPTRVVVWGGSSNVQLALPVAMDRGRREIRGAVIYYGDAPVTDIRTDLPLFFARAGLDSPTLNERIDALIGRALKANAPWTIENYGAGLHGFDIYNDTDVSREIVRRTLDFMKRVTTPELVAGYAAAADDAALGSAFARGEWAAAIAGYGKRVAANPGDADSHLRLGIALDRSGRPADALKELERAWELGRRGPRDVGLPAARAAARSGNNERALHWIGVLLSTPFVRLQDIEADEAFKSLIATPEFEALKNR